MRTKILLLVVFAVFFLSSIVLAVDCPIPDTRLTKCFDNESVITCPQPGEPFYGQDAQYSCNPQSYTKLDENGNDLPDSATEWVMVQDNVTGLIWENKTDDGSIHDKDNTYNWNDAQSVFITTLNNDNFGGYSDWRLPTIMELTFLVDRARYNPSINTTYFPNTVSSYYRSSYYWSSTTYADDPYDAWTVYFYLGYINYYGKSDYDYYVRAVRGGQCGSFDNFIDNGDGTVTSNDTGLMWELKTDDGGNRDKDNTYTWEEALSYCETLTLAGYSDWRLPNINELYSIVDYNTHDPSINTIFPPNTVSSGYWSSTTITPGTLLAWLVYFNYGYVSHEYKSYSPFYVRAVRQCGALDTSTTTTVASTTTTISSSTTTTISGSTTTTTIGYDPDCIEKWSTEFVISNSLMEDYFCFSPFDNVYRCDSINCYVKCGSSLSWTINLILVRVFEYWGSEYCDSGTNDGVIIGYNGFLFPLIGIGFGTFHYAYIEVPVVFRRIWW